MNAFLPTGIVRPPRQGDLYLCKQEVLRAELDLKRVTAPIYVAVDWEKRQEVERRLVRMCEEILDEGLLDTNNDSSLVAIVAEAKQIGIGT